MTTSAADPDRRCFLKQEQNLFTCDNMLTPFTGDVPQNRPGCTAVPGAEHSNKFCVDDNSANLTIRGTDTLAPDELRISRIHIASGDWTVCLSTCGNAYGAPYCRHVSFFHAGVESNDDYNCLLTSECDRFETATEANVTVYDCRYQIQNDRLINALGVPTRPYWRTASPSTSCLESPLPPPAFPPFPPEPPRPPPSEPLSPSSPTVFPPPPPPGYLECGYLVHNVTMTWWEAMEWCESQGAQPVAIKSSEENAAVVEAIYQAFGGSQTTRRAWLGGLLAWDQYQGSFIWSADHTAIPTEGSGNFYQEFWVSEPFEPEDLR